MTFRSASSGSERIDGICPGAGGTPRQDHGAPPPRSAWSARRSGRWCSRCIRACPPARASRERPRTSRRAVGRPSRCRADRRAPRSLPSRSAAARTDPPRCQALAKSPAAMTSLLQRVDTQLNRTRGTGVLGRAGRCDSITRANTCTWAARTGGWRDEVVAPGGAVATNRDLARECKTRTGAGASEVRRGEVAWRASG